MSSYRWMNERRGERNGNKQIRRDKGKDGVNVVDREITE